VIVVFRCTNGPVAYLLRRASQKTGVALCVNDQTSIALSIVADNTWIAAFTQMAAHAISLKGSLLETIVLPSSL
jgi:thiamine monophosphate synthase